MHAYIRPDRPGPGRGDSRNYCHVVAAKYTDTDWGRTKKNAGLSSPLWGRPHWSTFLATTPRPECGAAAWRSADLSACPASSTMVQKQYPTSLQEKSRTRYQNAHPYGGKQGLGLRVVFWMSREIKAWTMNLSIVFKQGLLWHELD